MLCFCMELCYVGFVVKIGLVVLVFFNLGVNKFYLLLFLNI